MSLHPQYARPRNLREALELLGSLGAGATVIAGGQELMPVMNYGKFMPTVLVDVNGLAELTGIRLEEGVLSIGALTVHRELQTNALVATHAPLLAESSRQAGGGWQVHNRGTIGGNIVSVHPLYDILPALLALGASVEIARPEAPSRQLTVAALLRETSHGLGTTTLLTRVLIPAGADARAGAGADRRASHYRKLKWVTGSYGSANAAALVTLKPDGRLGELRLALGAAMAKPADVSGEFAAMAGRMPNEALLLEVERISAASIREPLSDQQGDAAYRRAMAGVMARHAVAAAVRLAQ